MIFDPMPYFTEFFAAYPPVIPEMYWDVKSPEQRIKWLFKNVMGLEDYSESLTDTVNAQYKIIEKMQEDLPGLVDDATAAELRRLIESGEFDDLLEAAIEEYWTQYGQRLGNVESGITALRGDLGTEISTRTNADNAIRNQLTQDVARLETQDKRMEGMIVKAPYLKHSIVLVKCGEKNIVIDCADYASRAEVATALDSMGFTHVDYFVISHFHFDHCGAYDTVFARCDSSTKVFIPMTFNDQNASDYQDVVDRQTAIIARMNALGLNYEIPIQGSIVTDPDNDNLSLEFYNTDPAFKTSYHTAQAERHDNVMQPLETPEVSYNNYSLITRINFYGASFVDCADVENEAQKLNAQFMRPCTLARVPHHMTNRMGFCEFYNRLSPDKYMCSIYNNQLDTHKLSVNYQYNYLVRYFNQIRYSDVILNYKTETLLYVKDGSVGVRKGYVFDSRYNAQRDYSIPCNPRTSLPPACDNYDFYNYLTQFTLTELSNCNRKLAMAGIQRIQIENSTFMDQTALITELKQIFGSNIYGTVELIDGNIAYTRDSSALANPTIIMSPGFNVANYPDNTAYRLLNRPVTRYGVYHLFEEHIAVGADISTYVNAYFMRNNMLVASIENEDGSNYHTLTLLKGGRGSEFAGFGFNDTGSEIYVMKIRNNIIRCMFGMNLTTNVITPYYLKRIKIAGYDTDWTA